jgi:alpha/beta superfamily hydrolase
MGLGGMKYAWQRQTKDFAHKQADRYSSLVLDNRGIGESDKPFFRYSTSEMAKDVLEVVDHLGWSGKHELHVIGISMGGMIAQELVSPAICFSLFSRNSPGLNASCSNAFVSADALASGQTTCRRPEAAYEESETRREPCQDTPAICSPYPFRSAPPWRTRPALGSRVWRRRTH